MGLPTGLLPGFVFVATAGVASLVSLGAQLGHHYGPDFATALRAALATVATLYVLGVIAVWAALGGGALWGLPAALFGMGVAAFVVGGALPLAVGRRLVGRLRRVDTGTALQFATYGWPVSMLVVSGIFVAPGGPAGGHLFDLGGPRVCLLGFCGIGVPFLAVTAVELAVVVFGPGVVGAGLHALATRREPRLHA